MAYRMNELFHVNKAILCIYFFICLSLSGYSQANTLKTLDHNDFLIWKTIQDQQISGDGGLITYRLVPGEGDPRLMINTARDSSTLAIDRVSKSSISYDGKYMYGIITPHRDSLRAWERKKIDKKKWAPDTLFIREVNSGYKILIPYVTNYKAPEKTGDWLAYTLKKEAFEADTVKDKKGKKDIVHLIVRQLSASKQDTLLNVKEFTWSEKAPLLVAITEAMDSTQVGGVYYFKNDGWKISKKQKGEYSKPSISKDGSRFAFLANHDTTKAQIPPYELYYNDFSKDSAIVIAKSDTSKLSLVSQHSTLSWSEDSRYLYYGRTTTPFVKDTTLLEDESINVEIWSTTDPVLYTTQNVNKPDDEKKGYLTVFDTQTKKHVRVASLEYDQVALTKEKNTRYALVYSDKAYQLEVGWQGNAQKDMGIVDLQTGKLTTFKKGIYTSPRLSAAGKYAYGYSTADSTWWAYHIETNKFSYLNTKALPLFYDELNDEPGYPSSYGAAGWTQNDEGLLIYDRYDLWSWNPVAGNVPVRITKGRDTKAINRFVWTENEADYISNEKDWLIHVTDEPTKSTSYVWYTPGTKTIGVSKFEPFEYSKQVLKSRDADVYLFKKENFNVFPDLRLSKDNFATQVQISTANPQQAEYKWGTIELYEWMDWDSVKRTGLLVKPAGFDKYRSYPTIVNFYERYTQALHTHPTIEPHRSTINYAFYASRGYVIFNPDISYKVGYPGESAYQIVMSGVESLVKNRIADPSNMALQGHSWGGYQIAYIVTRTDVFKCAEAGASVVNMTSAYGGIRWGTGLSRMFQYEHEQSRIGRTLWEEPQKYIANSPLFKINKITTPLLLLHNDEDAAVPFEQGIEFYLALRRLGKTAWLLNYRGEPHWPVKWQNRKDFQLRMSQFFDHYLMGKPMPKWMSEGVPAIQRGINPGY